MPLSVSASYKAAQAADANLPLSQVQLVLGNYASASGYGSAAVASSSDGSGNYPASGAIDGDRTEINVGPASSADDDIGLSSWRSGTAPSATPQTLTITLTQARTLTRLKLYHLSSHGLLSFKFSYWTGSAFVDFASTPDLGLGTVFSTTGTLDTVDFPAISTTQVKLTVYSTQVANDKANVVELELYNVIDITSRVKGISLKRQRDYKLANPLAATVQIDCTNDDRFFSFSHVPTAAEAVAGFVNSEIRPEIGVVVKFGFNYFRVPELVQVFTGTLDRVSVKPGSRDAVLEARDGIKGLINTVEYTKLKTGVDVGTAVQYLLNRVNISNYEQSVDLTGITLDYFFVDDNDTLSTIRDLAQASGDALFYFTEAGIARFAFYAEITSTNQHVYTTQADFLAGTLSGLISATETADELVTDLVFDITITQHPTISIFMTTSGLATAGSPGSFSIAANLNGAYGYSAATAAIGSWKIFGSINATSVSAITLYYAFMSATTVNAPTSGYAIGISQANDSAHTFVALYRITGGGSFSLLQNADTGSSGGAEVQVVRYSNGVMNVYLNGSSSVAFTVTDTTYNSSSYEGILTTGSGGTGTWNITNYGTSNGEQTGTWTSPVLDTGSVVPLVAFGALTSTQSAQGGTITYETRSGPTPSPDGSWSAFVPLSGGNIASPVNRYLQTQVVMDPLNQTAPMVIQDITVNWTTGVTPSSKYPPPPASFVFTDSDVLLAMEQELADNLSGDTAILNDVQVQAQPLVLTGASSDVVFQYTQGSPPAPISVSNTLDVTTGQVITIAPYIAGGMDTSLMSGANPTALAVTFSAGTTGSWVCTSIHPTKPVFVLTISAGGSLTNLQVVGKVFNNASYILVQQFIDANSVALYGDRQLTLSNTWIINAALALDIASVVVHNYKAPTSYIPSCEVRPTFSAQVGDRVTLKDYDTDLNADYIIAEVSHNYSASVKSADVKTTLTLIKVPAGD